MQWIAAITSGILYALLFPPWNLAPLGFICLAPLAWALRGTGAGRGAALGLTWGVTAIWGFGHWVPEALATYWGQSSLFGYACALAGSIVFMGSYGAGFGACAAWLTSRRRHPAHALLMGATWVAWEVGRGRLLTGDPWLLLGYGTLHYPPLAQIADLGSVYLASFVLAVVSFTVVDLGDATATPRTRVGSAALACGLVAASLGYGGFRLANAPPPTPQLAVRLVQTNRDAGASWSEASYDVGLDAHLALSARGADERRPRLIVWPESAVTFFLEREPALLRRIQTGIPGRDTQLILGAPRLSAADPAVPRYFNSAYLMTRDAGIVARYDKNHLLPFGEYFPLHSIQLLRRHFERARSFTPGSEVVWFDTIAGRTAVVICFEAIFPELVRQRMAGDTGLLINLSNDAWLGNDSGPKQHEFMVRMRAIETRTWVLRSTTTGRSAIIDPVGTVTARLELGEAGVLDGSITPLHILTLYERSGDAFAFACIAITAVAGLREMLRDRSAV